MSKDLEFLIAEARKYEMTPADHEDQVRSFAFGNTHFENSAVSAKSIETAMTTLRAESGSGLRS